MAYQFLVAAGGQQPTTAGTLYDVGEAPPPGEAWQDWNKRTMRRARALLHHHKFSRWSTHSLQMQWNLWGHVGRAFFSPTFYLMRWRDLSWWRDQPWSPTYRAPRTEIRNARSGPLRDHSGGSKLRTATCGLIDTGFSGVGNAWRPEPCAQLSPWLCQAQTPLDCTQSPPFQAWAQHRSRCARPLVQDPVTNDCATGLTMGACIRPLNPGPLP